MEATIAIKRGTLMHYNPTAHTATILLAGSSTALAGVPVNRAIAAMEMVAGRRAAILIFDLANPGDVVLTAVWD